MSSNKQMLSKKGLKIFTRAAGAVFEDLTKVECNEIIKELIDGSLTAEQAQKKLGLKSLHFTTESNNSL